MAQIKSLYTGSKHTVISFSGIGNTLQGTNLEFYNLKNNGYNVIWVLDENKSWFNSINYKEITKSTIYIQYQKARPCGSFA